MEVVPHLPYTANPHRSLSYVSEHHPESKTSVRELKTVWTKWLRGTAAIRKMTLCNSVINKHRNICVGLVGMMLIFLAVIFHGNRKTDVHSKGGS